MSTTPPPAPPADPPADTSARMTKIEQEQARQGGMLEQILNRLGGQGQGGTPPAPGGGSGAGGVDLATIQQQVRDEITAADNRRAAEQKETKWKDDVNNALEQVKRERQPREPEAGVRGVVQRLLIGRQT